MEYDEALKQKPVIRTKTYCARLLQRHI